MDGTVTSFDAHEGLGTITTADGRTFGFHCLRIANGTRTIAVDTAVRFEVAASLAGRWEATKIVAALD